MACFLGIGFDDFNQTMENETVEVRIGQAVALHCGYVGTPVPKPEVTWLKDQVPIPIDGGATNPHYRVLEKGELVIYDLTMSDIMNGNSQPAQYRCRVDNVRIVENQTAPFFYTLYSNESSELYTTCKVKGRTVHIYHKPFLKSGRVELTKIPFQIHGAVFGYLCITAPLIVACSSGSRKAYKSNCKSEDNTQ